MKAYRILEAGSLEELPVSALIFTHLFDVVKALSDKGLEFTLYDLTTASVNLAMSFALSTEVPEQSFAEVFSSYCDTAIKSYGELSALKLDDSLSVMFSDKDS